MYDFKHLFNREVVQKGQNIVNKIHNNQDVGSRNVKDTVSSITSTYTDSLIEMPCSIMPLFEVLRNK